MEAFLNHVFSYAESYTVLLLWIIAPWAGVFGFIRYHRRWREDNEGRDAKDRRTA